MTSRFTAGAPWGIAVSFTELGKITNNLEGKTNHSALDIPCLSVKC